MSIKQSLGPDKSTKKVHLRKYDLSQIPNNLIASMA